MKKLSLIFILAVSLIVVSCDKDDDNVGPAAPTEGTSFNATIDGSQFSDYTFEMGTYMISRASGNTLSIDIADPNGQQITLFLNETDGFASGTTKQMGNIDAENFTTYGLFRQKQPQVSFYSNSGSVTITNNQAHPSKAGFRLISGNFNVITVSLEGSTELKMTGSFSELEYAE